jgi:hypothetical protein
MVKRKPVPIHSGTEWRIHSGTEWRKAIEELMSDFSSEEEQIATNDQAGGSIPSSSTTIIDSADAYDYFLSGN